MDLVILPLLLMGEVRTSESMNVVYFVLQKYHPARVLTIAYEPFALVTIAIMTYYEAKMNTRKRNLIGFWMFSISTILVFVVSTLYNDYSNYLLSSIQHFFFLILLTILGSSSIINVDFTFGNSLLHG